MIYMEVWLEVIAVAWQLGITRRTTSRIRRIWIRWCLNNTLKAPSLLINTNIILALQIEHMVHAQLHAFEPIAFYFGRRNWSMQKQGTSTRKSSHVKMSNALKCLS